MQRNSLMWVVSLCLVSNVYPILNAYWIFIALRFGNYFIYISAAEITGTLVKTIIWTRNSATLRRNRGALQAQRRIFQTDKRTEDKRTGDKRMEDRRTEDEQTEDRQTNNGWKEDGRTEDGWPDYGQTDDGRTDDGRTEDRQMEDKRTEDGGRTNGGRPTRGRPTGGRPTGGRPNGGWTNGGLLNDRFPSHARTQPSNIILVSSVRGKKKVPGSYFLRWMLWKQIFFTYMYL